MYTRKTCASDTYLPTAHYVHQEHMCFRHLSTNSPLCTPGRHVPQTLIYQQPTMYTRKTCGSDSYLPTAHYVHQEDMWFRLLSTNSPLCTPGRHVVQTLIYQQPTMYTRKTCASDSYLPTAHYVHQEHMCFRLLSTNSPLCTPGRHVHQTLIYQQPTMYTRNTCALDSYLPTAHYVHQEDMCIRLLSVRE
nr:hypothetical protein BgiMline_010496 [Biomphalaria glabrata]